MANIKNSNVDDTGFIKLAVGTTAQQPGQPGQPAAAAGMIRYNTTESYVEYHDGSQWNRFVKIIPETTYGNGSAGAVTTNGQLSVATHITSTTTSQGSTSILVSTTSGMSVGEKIFIHQTQCASVTADAGKFEINEIASIAGNTVNLVNPTVNTYRSGTYNTTNQSSNVAQVAVAKSYDTLTLNGLAEAKQWDGQSGGIIFITAKTSIDCNGHFISAFGKGYRGGRGSGVTGSQSSGYAGESIRGHYNAENVANDSGGAGADGNTNSGGDSAASGGHATGGGNGTSGGGTPVGGGSIGSQAMTEIHFGGGGGRGGDNDDRTFEGFNNIDTGANTTGSSGYASAFSSYTSRSAPGWGSENRHSANPDFSAGGGIVVIASPSITNLRATARGFPGFYGQSASEKSGCGASGSIYVITETGGMSITTCTVARQAQGSWDSDQMGPGSAGRIRFDIKNGTTYSGSVDITGSGTLQVNQV